MTLLGPEKLVWGIGNFGKLGSPSYMVGRVGHTLTVNPKPAYAPDVKTVEGLVRECCERFPLGGSHNQLTIISHEFEDGFNGITWYDPVWRDDEGNSLEPHVVGKHRKTGEDINDYEQSHQICLSAKVIPSHPAMLRYLVPHEYGHAVVNAIEPKLGYDNHELLAIEKDYVKERGLDIEQLTINYSHGFWHMSPGEIMANDFRILVMNREPEFWPHPGIDYPDKRMFAWWQNAAKACGFELEER